MKSFRFFRELALVVIGVAVLLAWVESPLHPPVHWLGDFAHTERAHAQSNEPSFPPFDCSTVSQIPWDDCYALVALYDSTSGATWTNKTGWVTTTTPCSWYGITCAGGRVTQIRLGSNALTGPMPVELSNLSALTWLELQYNNIKEGIPPELGQLSNLTELALYYNNINGTIPPELGDLTSLTALRLGNNQLSGAIPTTLGNLTNLKTLGMINNRLSGSLPTAILSLPNLTYLHLGGNQLTGAIPSQIGGLTKLRTLALASNQFIGDVPSSMTNLTALTDFDLGYNRLTASGATLINFLNSKDPDWAQTQTVPPSNIQATTQTSYQIQVSWTPIAYTGDGGYYEISFATAAGGPYTVKGVTADKSTTSYTATGLSPSTRYYFVVRSYTPPHGDQQSTLLSNYSSEASATTQADTTPTAPDITSTPVTTALRGQPYAYSVAASGSAPLTYALVSGPAGMSIGASTGLIAWTPNANGTFNVTVRVSNSAGADEQAFAITVSEVPVITSAAPTAGATGQPYAYDVDATGNPAPTFSLDLNPPGMTINPASGLISWTPSETGIFSVTVRAANSVGAATQAFAINVAPASAPEAPVFRTQPPLTAEVNKTYVYNVDASGNPPPTFGLNSPPTGMTINSTTGEITWTPTTAGQIPVSIQATNSAGTASQEFTVTVVAQESGDAFESDDRCGQAQPIPTNGAKQLRTFHDAGDKDWLVFAAQNNRTYVVEIVNLDPKADAVIELYDSCNDAPDGSGNNTFGRSVRLEWDATKNGDYFIKVTQYDGAKFGDDTRYTISVQVDTAPPSAPKSPRCLAVNNSTLGVQWRKSPERDVTGYRIAFTGNLSGNEDVAGADTTYYELGGLTPNQTYLLRVRAIDFSGNESSPSGDVQCLVTTPPDTSQPAMTLVQPGSTSLYTTTAFSLTFTGQATDPGNNLSRVQVRNMTRNTEGWDYSLSGGNDDFRVESVGLAVGDNQVQVAVYDDAGNNTQRTMIVRRLGEVPGAVIIIAGNNETFALQANIHNAANRAYRIFKSGGFSDDDILYLAPVGQDADGDGTLDTDGVSTPAAMQQAVTVWAKENGRVGPGKPLFIYMIDHGFTEKFCAAGCEAAGSITPADLDGWLRTLEAETGVSEVTVVIEACQSGSFIDRFNGDVANSLSKANRVIITSTGRENNAYASAQGAYFSDAFFSCVADSNTLKVCFDQAVSAVAATGVNQTPWLDDNGDGLFNSQDGSIAQNRRVTSFFSSIRPQIASVQVTKQGQADGVLGANVVAGVEEVELVWAAIYPPGFTEPDGVTLNLNVPTVRLEADPTVEGRYVASYPNGLPANISDYRIVFYAQDRLGINAQPRRNGQIEPIYLPVIRP